MLLMINVRFILPSTAWTNTTADTSVIFALFCSVQYRTYRTPVSFELVPGLGIKSSADYFSVISPGSRKFGPRSNPTFCGALFGPKLFSNSADDTSRLGVNSLLSGN